MTPEATEQRRAERKDSGAPALVAGWELDLVDLSSRGMGGYCARALPVGAKLPFALELPGKGRVEGKVQVRWAQALGQRVAHGLEIVEIGRLQRERLERHVNPRRFGWLEAFDLALEFGLAVAVVLAVRALFVHDPAVLQAAGEGLPWLFLAGAGAVGFWLVFPA